MARILFAWELGSGLGHLDRMLISARALRARGHELRFVLRDLSRAHLRLGQEGFTFGQAPVWLPVLGKPPRLNNFSTVLAAAGWLDPQGLAGLLTGWQQLLELHQPDLLVCDHAPTAMLAARGLGLKTCMVGNSFEVPPPGEHFPPLAFWDPSERAHCATSDARVLSSTNQALALLGRPSLPRLTDLMAQVQQWVVSLPDLAHYDGYPEDTQFLGPSFVGDSGIAPQWPAVEGKRVFVYLAPSHQDFAAVMAALRQHRLCALVFARGMSAEAATRLGWPGVRFETQPLHINQTLASADFVISHGSLGTVTAATLAGKPQLTLPNHMEQLMVSRRVSLAGIGLSTEPRSQSNDYVGLIGRLLSEPQFAASAQALAQRHAGVTPSATGERLAELLNAELSRVAARP
jgi:UDP:flavonoid glycosyltransferase YjiC (YdhE family)